MTDDHDRRLLLNILSVYMNEAVVLEEQFKLTQGGEYIVPNCRTQDNFIDYIRYLVSYFLNNAISSPVNTSKRSILLL